MIDYYQPTLFDDGEPWLCHGFRGAHTQDRIVVARNRRQALYKAARLYPSYAWYEAEPVAFWEMVNTPPDAEGGES